jgi:hypothetical protein
MCDAPFATLGAMPEHDERAAPEARMQPLSANEIRARFRL